MPRAHLTKDAAFDSSVVDRRARDVGARHRTARVDGPCRRDAASQRRVLLRFNLVAGLKRTSVSNDDAPDLLGAEASVRDPHGPAGDAVLAGTGAVAVAGPRASPRST